MKIGLLTIYNVPNYGALLQCYALSTYLKRLGYTVFLYDIPLRKSNSIVYGIKKKILLSFMTSFINRYLPESTTNLSQKADIYLVGSDQVWNPDILGNNVYKFMLSFVPSDEKKISYASSFGVEKWHNLEMYNEAKRLLLQFRNISVRETSGVALLKKQFDINAEAVLDPCFLLDDYATLFDLKLSPSPKNILVTYKLCYTHGWYTEISRIARDLQCKHIELLRRRIKSVDDFHGLNTKHCSVNKWLQYIANAKYVITDSFHGCVFSIIFKRQFVVIISIRSRATRILSLLNLLGLSNRIANSIDECESILSNDINYDEVYQKLDILKNTSKTILERFLKQ